ncbi:capsular exopolysaccharide family [Anaerobranca californiensis DSM 14826]|jgi:capsular exopolysaccharide synthesis family protein|uniref:non-specific protein-tyrosine kinase n=1 Tax=Anaerobranca californiensis DSM 14826 TaxID=1120989 RepID=A0A1M6RWV2_9FIRM|nr:polysaccharide biosynthesis tyrosine autokinase [Anaerobranca californiensis]SHK36966.1 capsular exopolysaccharide family [Anaerobranca californiensis DSM 14826]
MEAYEYEIDLRELFEIILNKLWLIILIVLITTITTSVVSFFFLDKVYEASTKLVLVKGGDSDIQYNDVLLNQRLVKTYSEIASSRTIAEEVINNLKLNMSYGEFSNKVRVNSVRDTEVIEIKVQDTNPQLAARIANELSEVFIDRIHEFIKMENVRILDYAVVPSNPIKPRPMLNIAIALVLGLMIGIGLVFLLEYLDNSFKGPDDVEKRLNLPVLGAVPAVENENSLRLITMKDPKSPISEAYRILRTNIQFSNLDNKLKTILVTSSGPAEGKSTTISNLAVTMVNMGHKVLLIDADFRKPQIHKIFNLSNDVGMTNILMGEKLEDVIHTVGGLKLDIITTGPIPPNPSEILGSNAMKKFIEQCKEYYDIILIDSPPAGIVTDAAVLSKITDGTLFVVAAGQTTIELAQKAKDMLDKVQAKVIGVLVNKVNIEKRRYQYYYYYLED